MKYALTETDLPYLKVLLEKAGLDERRQEAILRSIEIIPEEAVAATEHVEVDLGGEDHLQYLAKIALELIKGMGDRWIPGYDEINGLPDPGIPGGSGTGPSGDNGRFLEAFMEVWKSAHEPDSPHEGHSHSKPPKKQKVIHHPGKQWLDPGWYEKR